VKVGCGKRFVSVLDNLGQLWGCGNNQYKVFKSLPETIHIFTIAEVEVTDFAVGWNHLVYANKSGKVFSYGLNSLGQLGH
jgi:alpha-tubulin suppressor-like RCC1 family protein